MRQGSKCNDGRGGQLWRAMLLLLAALPLSHAGETMITHRCVGRKPPALLMHSGCKVKPKSRMKLTLA